MNLSVRRGRLACKDPSFLSLELEAASLPLLFLVLYSRRRVMNASEQAASRDG